MTFLTMDTLIFILTQQTIELTHLFQSPRDHLRDRIKISELTNNLPLYETAFLFVLKRGVYLLRLFVVSINWSFL